MPQNRDIALIDRAIIVLRMGELRGSLEMELKSENNL